MIEHIRSHVFPVMYQILPWKMQGADQMLLAIGLQESNFQYRRQIGGPAKSFWQMEAGGGVKGVMEHHATQAIIYDVFAKLKYPPLTISEAHSAIEHNDILAACFARLLLWSDPNPLPGDMDAGWEMYNLVWRPGKPRPEHWQRNWQMAQAVVATGRVGV